MTLLTDSILLDVLGVVTAVVAVIYTYFLWSYQYWKRRNVPSLEPTFPWGNMENPRTRTMYIGEWIKKLYQDIKGKGYNKYCGLYSLARPSFWVLDLDLVKQVMAKDFHNFVDRGFYTNEKEDPLGCHVFSIGGVKWRNLRTKLTPTFTSGKMKGMFSTLVDCGMVLEKYIENSVDNNEPVDIKEVLGNFSTDIIGSCAFGLECNSFKDPNSPFREYGKKIFTSTFGSPKFAFATNFPKIATFLRLRITPKDVNDFFMKVVEDTVAYREKNNYSRNDFLQLLIDVKNNKEGQEVEHKGDGKTLTMDELAAQCFVFFFAGFETSSTTMTFALYELARNQNYQDKVREEINTVLAKHDGKVTYDSLSELKYMKQVIDETLRMYPPVGLVTRICGDDYKLPGEDVVIEKGTRVLIPIHGIHYDEEYYEKPNVFDPERFTEDNKAKRHPYAHIPFGEGPRICLGERFGIMQTKVGLTTILRNFQVSLNKKTKIPLQYSTVSFVPAAKDNIYLDIKKI